MSKARIKYNLCESQEKNIEDLDEILEKTRYSHMKLRKRIENFETELYENRDKEWRDAAGISILQTENSILYKHQSSSFMTNHNPKSRFVRRFTKRSIHQRKISPLGSFTGLTYPFQSIQEEGNMNLYTTGNTESSRGADPELSDVNSSISINPKNPRTLDDALIFIKEQNKHILKLKLCIEQQQKDIYISSNHLGTGGLDVQHMSLIDDHHPIGPGAEEEKLHERMRFLNMELELQTTRADQLKKAYLHSKEQIKTYRNLIIDIEDSSKLALKDENESWQRRTTAMKVFIYIYIYIYITILGKL